MKRLLLAVLLATLCAGLSRAESLRERYWRLHRERNPTTRYGAVPYVGTNAVYTGSSGGGGALGDLVVTCNNFEISAYSHVGPINGQLRFTVPFETAQGWTGYVLEGHTPPTDPEGCMSEEYIICDPATGGNLVMMWNYGSEFLSISGLYTDEPTVQNYFGSYTGTLVFSRESAGPAEITVDAAVSMAPEDIAAWLSPPPGTGEVSDGDLWIDCLAIPEGNWLVECPVAGTSSVEWRAALCQSNLVKAVVWRHSTGLAPTNLPVTIAHDPTRTIGRIERLYYEDGTGVIARIRVRSEGYAEAISNRCGKISPDLLCFTTVTNVAIRRDGWTHEHQNYIDERCVPRGEDMSSETNVPAGVTAVVMAPVYLTGLSLVRTPMLPTYIEQVVPVGMTNAYPVRPPRPWHW